MTRRPLYWLLISAQDKPEEVRLRREPLVWLYFCATAFWGFACAAFTQGVVFSTTSDSTIIEIIKWIAGFSIFPLPTIILTIREADKAGSRYTFDQLLVSAIVGWFSAVFLGALIEFSLSFAGVHRFLGVPINPWR